MIMQGGIGGIIILGGVLYFTGAGSWMLDRMGSLEGQCHEAVASMGVPVIAPVCGSIGKGVGAITRASNTAGERLHAMRTSILGGVGSDTGGSSVELSAFLQRNIGDLTSPGDHLSALMDAGPQLPSGGSMQQQFQRAIDSFSIGQTFAQHGDTAQAIPWLTQSAQQPDGFGFMSQLSLADLYRTGGKGIAADPLKSQNYYQLASGSLSELKQGNSVQSKQILDALPISPQEMQKQIDQTLNAMKHQRR